MRVILLATLTAVLLLGACAKARDSKLNPFNWFQRSAPVDTLEPEEGYDALTDNRILVDQVVGLVIEAIPGGAVVRATGLPPTQGYWSAELLPENDGVPVNGELSFRFVVAPPPDVSRVSTVQSREISVAVYLSNIDLAEVRRITVLGARTSRSAAR